MAGGKGGARSPLCPFPRTTSHCETRRQAFLAKTPSDDAREVVTNFGFTQPGAEIALKVFVVLTTGNETGSATMLVERPVGVKLLAA